MTRSVSTFAMEGGLNLAREHIKLAPGELIAGQNIDITIGGGYRRADGYERIDGTGPSPRDNTYQTLAFNGGGPREITTADTLEGETSAVTAVGCGPALLTSGAWDANTAAGTIGATLATGQFIVGERIFVSGVYAFTCAAVLAPATLDDPNRESWTRGSANAARNRILAVPGSGPIRGVADYNGTIYAFRDNAAATACVMHKAAINGWQPVVLSQYIAFNLGGNASTGAALQYLDLIVGTTSGASYLVGRVAFRSGSWASQTAVGLVAVIEGTGAFILGETFKVGGVVYGTVTSAGMVSPTLPPGGRYEFDQWNFYGSFDTKRLYGCNGVGPAFEFNNNDFLQIMLPIKTGMTDDAPEHIAVHKNYLYLTFKGSVQNSGAGEPHAWTPRLGAGEFGVGDQVTALRSIRQDVLGIATNNSLSLLYGSSLADWSLKKLSREIGCFPGCMTEIPGSTALCDTNGVISLEAVQAFGDLKPTTLSVKIDAALRGMTGTPIGMGIERNSSQLRLYFDDGKAFYATYIGANIAGWCPMVFPDAFFCVASGENAAGQAVQYAGGANGYVYTLNVGNSFDGQAIDSWFQLPFHHYGSPQRKKRFRKIALEMDSFSPLEILYTTQFNYGDPQYGAHTPMFLPNNGGLWDRGVFGLFVYDGGVLTEPSAQIAGVGKTMSVLIRIVSDVAQQWTIQTAHIHYSPWGVQR